MKPSRAIGVGLAMTAIAGWAWVGCSSSTSTSPSTNSSTSSSTGTGTGTGTGTSTSSGSSGTGTGTGTSTSADAASDAAAPLSFAADIYPAFVLNCLSCHHAAGDPMPNDGGIYDASGGGVLRGNLDLAASVDAAYANLIEQDAEGISAPYAASGYPTPNDGSTLVCDTLDAATPGHIRVVPFDAGQSLLCLKLKGWLNDGDTPPPCGAPMPLLGPLDGSTAQGGLTQQQAFEAVGEWINEGANP
jgi:hypothetical protein